MSKCDKLLEQAQRSPHNLSFSDVCYLAECYGFEFKRSRGSHFLYENEKLSVEQNRILNLQDFNGKAKSYQVHQLLKAIEALTHGE